MPTSPLSWETDLPNRCFRADALSLILPVLTAEQSNSGRSRHWHSRWVLSTLLGPLAKDCSLPVWILLSAGCQTYLGQITLLTQETCPAKNSIQNVDFPLVKKTFETHYLTPCIQFRYVFWCRCTRWDKLVALLRLGSLPDQGVRHALVWLHAWHILTM